MGFFRNLKGSFIKKVSLSLLFLFSDLAFSAVNNVSPDVPWLMESPVTSNQWKMENMRARIVVFRLGIKNDDFSSLPLNVFFNKNYHASLYPEHQALSLSVCPGSSLLTLVPLSQTTRIMNYQEKEDVHTPDMKAGNIYFYQVAIDESGKSIGRWVDSKQAISVLSSINIQAHTLSRVVDEDKCPTEKFIMNASALFKFSKYDEAGLQSGAFEELKEIAYKITDEYERIDKLVVSGYADPIGTIKGNLLLSDRRASTVVNQLVRAGLPASIISSRGLGSENLIITGCDKYKKHSEVITCNQPNRRVEIEVYGVKKNSGI